MQPAHRWRAAVLMALTAWDAAGYADEHIRSVNPDTSNVTRKPNLMSSHCWQHLRGAWGEWSLVVEPRPRHAYRIIRGLAGIFCRLCLTYHKYDGHLGNVPVITGFQKAVERGL